MDLQAMKSVLQKMNERLTDMVNPDGQLTKYLQAAENRMSIFRQKLKIVGDKAEEATTESDRIKIMADIIVRQDQRIYELEEKLLMMQSRSMKNNIIVSGIQEKKGEKCDQVTKAFIQGKLKVEDPKIDVSHRIGTGNNRPIVVRFPNVAEKAKIFSNISNLKGVKNEQQKSYRIDNQLPEELSERRRIMAMHHRDVKGKQQEDRFAMSKGVLMIDGSPYRKEVRPPNPADLMFASKALIARSNQIVLHESKTVTERGSTFIAYMAEAQSMDDIRAAYIKMRRMHGQATHVSCAYRLTQCIGPINQDAVDDGEHGAARNLLHYLKAQDLFNTVIFVVRYYGGAKLGPSRFQIIMDVAKDAHNQLVNTSFTEMDQQYQHAGQNREAIA